MKLGLLLSGELGLISLKKLLQTSFVVSTVLTDQKSEAIIDVAKKNRIPLFIGNPRNGKARNFLSNLSIEVLLSVNYLFIVDEDILSWPEKYAINFHGSLLPKYRGRTPHVWAIINNEKFTGITAHLMNKGCDTGDICYQIKVPINVADTGASILKKFKRLYPKLIFDVLKDVETNNLTIIGQDETKATFFGKRTPEDGQINWNWQKERIYNWVRAQAYPYPGAFTFCNDQKVIIDQVEFDDFGFSYDMLNGFVLSVEPLRIKTQNGVLSIKSIRNQEIKFEKNSIFK